MSVELTPAYILHQRPYRETSLLLDVFSREQGRVNLVAKGAKRKNSDWAGLLQPSQRLLLSWTGNGDLMTLTGAENDGSRLSLGREKLITVFYLNELVVRLLHRHEAHADLFDAYDHTLVLLAPESTNNQNIIRTFEKQLLQAIGYGPVLDHDVSSGTVIDPARSYYYQADLGPLPDPPAHGDYITLSGDTLRAMAENACSTTVQLREAKKLMRYLLQKHLGDKPLASRALLRSYRKPP